MDKPPSSILPYDGQSFLEEGCFSSEKSINYFNQLFDAIHWEHDVVMMFGKKITTKRKVAWYGTEAFPYKYSKMVKTALPWNTILLELKHEIERITNESYNSCLINLYHNGLEGMSWHSDNEPELKPNGAIASVSFGAVRRFMFKHKATKETISLQLSSGSILVMKGLTQNYWQHQLPVSTNVKDPRINLTFRTIQG